MANVILVAGLGYGDEGKGTTVDYLARHGAHTVVRYNGGAQAAHNVVTADGRHHTFAQFGAGMLAPGVRTHLSRHMLVNPLFLMTEQRHLREIGVRFPFERLTVERTALVTNPFQVATNRLREMARNKGRHGSCGMGIGETVADFVADPDMAIRMTDLQNPKLLRRKLWHAQSFKAHQMADIVADLPKTEHVAQEWDMLIDGTVVDMLVERLTWWVTKYKLVDENWLHGVLHGSGTVVFEGAQGVLLDQDYGTFPYVTRSKTTFENAYDLLDDFEGPVTRLGILRSYLTRHGAGPFVTEDSALTYPEKHNGFGPWQEGWRRGHFDLVALDYAIRAIGGVDEIALTHMDYIDGPQKVCTAYDIDWPLPTADTEPERLKELAAMSERLFKATPTYEHLDLIPTLEAVAAAPVTLTSHGPTAEDKHGHRSETGNEDQTRRRPHPDGGGEVRRGGSLRAVSRGV